MDLFNGANMNDLCNSCIEFVDDIKDKSDDSEGDNCSKKRIWLFLTFLIAGEQVLIDLFFAVCDEFFGSQFCSDATEDLISSIYESITNPAVNSTWACQRLAMCPYLVNNDTLNPFVDDVLQNKPENDIPAAANRSTYQVLHMTDIHLDFSYQEVGLLNWNQITLKFREHGQGVEDSNVVEQTVETHQILMILMKLLDIGVA